MLCDTDKYWRQLQLHYEILAWNYLYKNIHHAAKHENPQPHTRKPSHNDSANKVLDIDSERKA